MALGRRSVSLRWAAFVLRIRRVEGRASTSSRSRARAAILIVSGAWTVVGALPLAAQRDIAFPPDVYAERRARLASLTGDGPVVVTGAYMIRSGGEGRQDPNFYYLTGVESPYAVFAMAADGQGGRREVLFLPDSFQFAGAQYPMDDPRFRHAAWNRTIRRLAPGRTAEAVTGIAETRPVDDLKSVLAEMLADQSVVYLAREGGSPYAPPGMGLPRTVRGQLEDAIVEIAGPARVENVTPLIERQRLVKDAHEVARLREAARISSMGLTEGLRRIQPGMNDLELAGFMEYVWKREGAQRTAFSPIVASGESAVSLYTLRSERYNSTDRIMRDGELVFIDYGAAEVGMYASDICRTFPVSGRFTDRQRRYYEIVLRAQDAALAEIRPGVMMRDVIRAAAGVFKEEGLAPFEDIDAMGPERVWGLMPSPTYWIDRNGDLTDYSGARGSGVRDLGHHIGLEALDSRDYSVPLEPGMVFTVEPKIYIPEEGIAIMIEDMVLVTDTGYENLSASAPRTVDEIERIMAGS